MDRYNVNVEFEKYSKKFERVEEPQMMLNNGSSLLVIQDRYRTYYFNMRFVHYWTREEAR